MLQLQNDLMNKCSAIQHSKIRFETNCCITGLTWTTTAHILRGILLGVLYFFKELRHISVKDLFWTKPVSAQKNQLLNAQ